MRKCTGCGYLLLGEGETCGRCGAALTSAPATVAAAPAGPPSGPAWAPPPVPVPVPALRESWQPVNVVEPVPTKPRATRLGIVVVAVVVALGVGLAVPHFRSDPLPAGTSAFVSGQGSTYTAPDGGFQVLLPKDPGLDQRTATVNGELVQVNTAAVGDANYSIAAASVVFPSALQANRVNQSLEDAFTGDVSGVSGKVVHKDLTMRGSLPALEGKIQGPNGYRVRMLIVASGATMVMLVVSSKSGTDRLYKALEDSLVVR